MSPVFVRGEQSMSNLVSYKKVNHVAASTLPARKSKHTGLNVEASSAHALVLHHDVFGGKQLGESTFDF